MNNEYSCRIEKRHAKDVDMNEKYANTFENNESINKAT